MCLYERAIPALHVIVLSQHQLYKLRKPRPFFPKMALSMRRNGTQRSQFGSYLSFDLTVWYKNFTTASSSFLIYISSLAQVRKTLLTRAYVHIPQLVVGDLVGQTIRTGFIILRLTGLAAVSVASCVQLHMAGLSVTCCILNG